MIWVICLINTLENAISLFVHFIKLFEFSPKKNIIFKEPYFRKKADKKKNIEKTVSK